MIRNPVILDQVNMDYNWKFLLTPCLLRIVLVQAISRKRFSSEKVMMSSIINQQFKMNYRHVEIGIHEDHHLYIGNPFAYFWSNEWLNRNRIFKTGG